MLALPSQRPKTACASYCIPMSVGNVVPLLPHQIYHATGLAALFPNKASAVFREDARLNSPAEQTLALSMASVLDPVQTVHRKSSVEFLYGTGLCRLAPAEYGVTQNVSRRCVWTTGCHPTTLATKYFYHTCILSMTAFTQNRISETQRCYHTSYMISSGRPSYGEELGHTRKWPWALATLI